MNSFISYGLTSFKHKNSIVGKYFPEINSINVSWQAHKFRRVIELLHHFAIQLLQEWATCRKEQFTKASGRSIKISPNQVVCILAHTNALIVIHCYAKLDRNEETDAACKEIFFHLFFILRCSSLQESILNLFSIENSTTSKQLNPPNILMFLLLK